MILTLLRIILTPLIILCLIEGQICYLYAFLIFNIAAVTDYLDGYFARKNNAVSDLGRFLDPLADKILIISCFFAFYYLDIINFWMVLVILLRDLFITFLRIVMSACGYYLKTSFFAKIKTAFQFFAIYLIFILIILDFLVNISDFKVKSFFAINILMYLVVMVTILSGIDYLIKNRFFILEWIKVIGQNFIKFVKNTKG